MGIVTLRLHWLPGSAAMAPHAALAEIGVEYELVRVERDESGRGTDAYLRLNPSGRVPTLEDGELVVTESAAILLHLADRFPEAGLIPPVGSDERTELYTWLVYLTNTVQPTMMRFFYPERYGDDNVRDVAAGAAQTEFARIDQRLADREWVVGSSRSVADLFLFMVTRFGRRLEPPAWDSPNLRRHALRTFRLPGVRRMMEEQDIELPPFADD